MPFDDEPDEVVSSAGPAPGGCGPVGLPVAVIGTDGSAEELGPVGGAAARRRVPSAQEWGRVQAQRAPRWTVAQRERAAGLFGLRRPGRVARPA